ncbi:hypothetical protein DL96DRAFT_1820549 [Flagelloscypha sp. PMI_526]|nr:hypothetical protein DL96DRAFT_1820549 [Flagelloscypha sp. PMI_526]
MRTLHVHSTGVGSCALGLDVLTEIFHFIHDTSRADIFTIILVNELFHDVALPFTVRECSLDFGIDNFEASRTRISFWLEPNNRASWVLPHIRHFTVLGTPHVGGWLLEHGTAHTPTREEKWRPLLLLIPALRKLVQFTFACPQDRIPAELLQALEVAHSQVSLTVKHWELGGDRKQQPHTIVVDPDEEALIQSPLLRKLELEHPSGRLDISYTVLRWIIARSINLDSLIINPIVKGLNRRSSPIAKRARREHRIRAANLFVIPSTIQKKLFKCLRLNQCSASFADFCIRRAEPSALEDLQCSFPLPSLVTLDASQQLTALRHLKLKIGPVIIHSVLQTDSFPLLQALISGCVPLETLSLTSTLTLCPLVPAIVSRHGQSLRALTLLHTPHKDGSSRLIPLSVEDIFSIAQACPYLQDLTLTVGRAQSTPEVTKALGNFACLSNLTLIFPEDPWTLDGRGTFSRPFEDQAYLEGDYISDWEAAISLQLPVHSSFIIEIFQDIIKQGCSLEKLEVELGERKVRGTNQQFVVNLCADGKVNIESRGYVLPEDEDVDWKLNAGIPRLKRLRRLWYALLPKGLMPSILRGPISTPQNN